MYWNIPDGVADEGLPLLNSNIRCIEMKKWSLEEKCEFGWIVTLDVLK